MALIAPPAYLVVVVQMDNTGMMRYLHDCIFLLKLIAALLLQFLWCGAGGQHRHDAPAYNTRMMLLLTYLLLAVVHAGGQHRHDALPARPHHQQLPSGGNVAGEGDTGGHRRLARGCMPACICLHGCACLCLPACLTCSPAYLPTCLPA